MRMLTVELNTREIPEIYDAFADRIGEQHWRRLVAILRDEVRGNRFLEHLYENENAIAFQLERLAQLRDKYGSIPLDFCNDRSIYPAASFAAQVLSVLEKSEREFAERVRRRVHGAFKNPADIRAIRLEFSTATHFIRRGRAVSWPELTGVGTFDLLVEDIGPSGLEVECKAFSEDKGRKIIRKDALDFFGLLWAQHRSAFREQRTGIAAVLTLPQRLPTSFLERKALAAELAQHMRDRRNGRLAKVSGEVTVSEFDAGRLKGLADGKTFSDVRGLMNDITGTKNRQVMVVGTSGGALALVLQSALDDTLLRSMFETLRDSASRQFSQTRGAMFVAGIEGIETRQLLDIAAHDRDPERLPTGLRVETSKFLASSGRDHIVGVGFLSASALRPVADDLVDSGGAAYYFPKKESPFWSDAFSGLFNWQEPAPLAVAES